MAVPFGKYLLQRKLAEGGMAEIFLARQAGLEGFEKLVVVKRLLPQLGAEADFVRMFLNEARLAARLNHPNIVQIFELGTEQNAYYLAMEYIFGEDLRSLAQQADLLQQRPPLHLLCRIIIDVLAGLHYAHTRTGTDGKPLGLVHRDVSPQNILVTYEGGVKLIDFGIAKATQVRQAEQTQAGLLKGKYAYMSPEQTRGGQLDARSDAFSAGILLWELVTWRRLFKRATDLATLVAISEEPAPPMSLLNQEVPEELDRIALRALAVDPADRFASAQDFQAALEECVSNQGWQADARALSHYMKDLFRDKLASVQAEGLAPDHYVPPTPSAGHGRSAESSGVPGPRMSGPMRTISARRELPLQTMPLQALDPASRPAFTGMKPPLPVMMPSPPVPVAPVPPQGPPDLGPLPADLPVLQQPVAPMEEARWSGRRRVAFAVGIGVLFGLLVVVLLYVFGMEGPPARGQSYRRNNTTQVTAPRSSISIRQNARSGTSHGGRRDRAG